MTWGVLITVRGETHNRWFWGDERELSEPPDSVPICQELLRTNAGGLMASSQEEKRRVYRLCLAVEYFSIDGSPECVFKDAFAARNKVLRWFLIWLVLSCSTLFSTKKFKF